MHLVGALLEVQVTGQCNRALYNYVYTSPHIWGDHNANLDVTDAEAVQRY